MRKLKVYLDTSVISHLLQEDVPEKMADTRAITNLTGYKTIDILSPSVLLESEG